MHRILVERTGYRRADLHALLTCCAGTEAQQSRYMAGLHRTAGVMAGGLFILPGVIAIMGLSLSTLPTAMSDSSRRSSG